MPKTRLTIEQQIKAAFDGLTRAERQLASHIMRNYPVAALGSITALAKGAEVSTPTVVRLTQKLGYKGYPDFQSIVRSEVEERLISPLAKHDRWAEGAPQTHMLNRFADAVIGNLQATLAQIDHAEFDAIAALLADPSRRVYATGGRITHALADYFVTHMTVIRQNVVMVSERSSAWPPALIDMRAGDVLLVLDIRRYENGVLQLAEIAASQGAEVVLVTDQWLSPAAAIARHRLAAHVEAPSAWDSTIAILLLLETLLAAVENLTWDETRTRMRRLEELYARSRLFRRGK
ncbi:MAG: MurR/RpiR family transcriptional regulator [Proteobacteria bacterium]|nr:MurR/RpiR family transcriptional regulator [Pseudomonadota bacterium]MBS0574615.1 MurR/RpiR family transcriptional regulator [Pseudomonadota bacterium]